MTIGAVGLAVIATFMLAAFRAEDLPLIGGGTTTTPHSPRPAG